MELQRPATYRPETWDELLAKFSAMSHKDLANLAHRGSIAVHKTESPTQIIEALLKHGGFLLVEFPHQRRRRDT